MFGAWRLREFGFSRQDLLPRFGQLESHEASADQGGEGQEDGDYLGDADEGCEDEAGNDGGKLTDSIQDAECCPPAKWEEDKDRLDARPEPRGTM